MADRLSFFQVYYDHGQKAELYPFAIPYYSVGLTPYFENSIIAGLVPTVQSDYISVCSWRLKRKRGDCQLPLGNALDLSEEKILSTDADVCILTPRSARHDVLGNAESWHGRAWVDAFNVFKGFLSDSGVAVGNLTAIYENHFVARREIYHDYVNNLLIPACDFVGSHPVFELPSGYAEKKRLASDIPRVQKLLNRHDWPILPFILERLFSIYIHGKNFKIVNV